MRAGAADVRLSLARLPAELERLVEWRADAELSLDGARAELARAEARLVELETARLRRGDELERALSEAATARDARSDAHAQLERLAAKEAQLQAEQASLGSRREQLGEEATAVAADLRAVDRLAEAARRDPGPELEDLEEWGAQARSALFVVRGTLETERERIVTEANALGSAVLGEQLGGSSVAVVRRRVDAALRSS